MTPFSYDDKITIPVAILAKFVNNALTDILPALIIMLICIAGCGSVITKVLKPRVIMDNPFWHSLFNVTPIWLVARIAGICYGVMTLWQIGPEWIWSENTAGLVLYDLLTLLFAVFLFAGMFLPLLLNFGLLEFFGALLTKVMRPVFTLPGRSSIDCITSWLGDGTVGVMLTSKQYEDGYYTKREAAVIATTFSVVSITFSLVVISQVDLEHLFVPYYLTITLCGVVAAIILPRIPPLSRKQDTYYGGINGDNREAIPTGFTPFSWGINQAVIKANKNANLNTFLKGGIKNVLDLWIGVTPIIMAFGATALIIAEYTPLFQWLGVPFIPLLQLLQVPEAVEASQTIIIGFADMFLPSVLGSKIESEMTRFVIACTSVCQLIYISEVGGLILGSKIPLNLKELFIIFMERTLISLPIIALVAHILF
jgi:nucleoside recognition membrane protein YjiH